ncbi:hypothetical protein [Pantoea stewartii]|uniref:hypothetical protein n=1 Tax=Pantoea stewartii TaxID=66269 RepID=UPI0025A19468|nr:hypothetical protein [Pantoea stewartii]
MAKGKIHKKGGRKAVTSQQRRPASSTPASATKSTSGGHVVLRGGGSVAGEIKSAQLTGISEKKEAPTTQPPSSLKSLLSEKEISFKNIIFLFFFILWLIAYLGCEVPVNRFLNYPSDQSLVKDAVSKLRMGLNFLMSLAVLVATFFDRAMIYREISFKRRTDAREVLDSMLLPFALALVPFTTASVDLGESIANLNLALSLVLFFIALVTIIDYVLLIIYKLDINKLYRVGKVHIQVFIISVFLFLLFGFDVYLNWCRKFLSVNLPG